MKVEDVNWTEVIKESKFKDMQTHRGKPMPYILFGAIENAKREEEAKPTLVCINIGAHHAQIGMIDYYVFDKKFKLLKWWFPTSESYKNKMAQAGNIRTDSYSEVQMGVWESLDNHCRQLTGKDAALDEMKASNEALVRKVKELEEKENKRK